VELKPIRLEDETALCLDMFRVTDANLPYRQPLVVLRFVGTYRIGCQGNPDALWMTTMVCAAKKAFRPGGIVLDFQQLSYEWGDMIDRPIREAWCEDVRPAVVTSPRCHPALVSLFASEGEDGERLFATMEAAVCAVEQDARELQIITDALFLGKSTISCKKLSCQWDTSAHKDHHQHYRTMVERRLMQTSREEPELWKLVMQEECKYACVSGEKIGITILLGAWLVRKGVGGLPEFIAISKQLADVWYEGCSPFRMTNLPPYLQSILKEALDPSSEEHLPAYQALASN
jgi:hypothetical protein